MQQVHLPTFFRFSVRIYQRVADYSCSSFSVRRCSKHYSGPDIYICVEDGRQGCSHCACYLTVSRASITTFGMAMLRTRFMFTKAALFFRYLIALILFWRLQAQVDLLSPSLEYLQLGRFIKNGENRHGEWRNLSFLITLYSHLINVGFQLLTRVIAVTFCVTLAASLAARLGSIEMAAFQVCLQVWLASSLLADGLAVAGQVIQFALFPFRCSWWRKEYRFVGD